MTEPSIIIHYWRGDVKQAYPVRTGCGVKIRDLPEEARLVTDTESVDCEACLASDEYKAQAMEHALVPMSHIEAALGLLHKPLTPGIFPPQTELHVRIVPAPKTRARRHR